MTKLAMSAVATAVLGLAALQPSNSYALDRSFYLVNNSDRAVAALRVGHIDRDTWVPIDLLGEYVIRPGRRMQLDPVRHQGYCRFDIQVTFDNGDVQKIWDVNLCEATELITYGYNRSRNAFSHKVIYG
jgi:hypothetical protein